MQQEKKRLATAGLFVCGVLILMLPALSVRAQQPVPANAAFLVAHPRIADVNFRETVVLITQPEVDGGPMGVIINKPVKVPLSQAVPDLGKVPGKYDTLYRGGPVVPERIAFLVRTARAPAHSLHVLPGVYLTGDRDVLEKILSGETKVDGFRAFAGVSSWAPGQLQGEILRGDWYLVKADVELLFVGDVSLIWGELIERVNLVKTRRKTDLPDPSRVIAVEQFELARPHLLNHFGNKW